MERLPACKIGCGLDDVFLTGLSIEPEVERIRRAHTAGPQLRTLGNARKHDEKGDTLRRRDVRDRVSHQSSIAEMRNDVGGCQLPDLNCSRRQEVIKCYVQSDTGIQLLVDHHHGHDTVRRA